MPLNQIPDPLRPHPILVILTTILAEHVTYRCHFQKEEWPVIIVACGTMQNAKVSPLAATKDCKMKKRTSPGTALSAGAQTALPFSTPTLHHPYLTKLCQSTVLPARPQRNVISSPSTAPHQTEPASKISLNTDPLG